MYICHTIYIMVKIFVQTVNVILSDAQIKDFSAELQGEQEAKADSSPADRELRELENFINS